VPGVLAPAITAERTLSRIKRAGPVKAPSLKRNWTPEATFNYKGIRKQPARFGLTEVLKHLSWYGRHPSSVEEVTNVGNIN
jgi:hypothetical protein